MIQSNNFHRDLLLKLTSKNFNRSVFNFNRIKKNQKETRACLCVSFVSINLIFSYAIFSVIWPLSANCDGCVQNQINAIVYWLSYFFPCIDPLIVLIFNQNFKKIFILSKIIRKNFHSKSKLA